MKTSRIMAALFTVFTWAANRADAAPVTQEQAQKAVQTFLSRETSPLGAKIGGKARQARTFNREGHGTPLFHVVALEGGGFVVTSADTRVSPIIAVAEGEDIVVSSANPLWTLLNRDLPQRMDAAAQGAQAVQPKTAAQDAPPPAEQQWASLLAGGLAPKTVASATSIDDVRVEPLVRSRWGQSTVGGKAVYNFYTPNNSVCGCVATAGAQVMRFYQYPASAAPLTYKCWVNNVATNLTMEGGTYRWADMPEIPDANISDIARAAIGKLTYDVGVASQMQYWNNSSGTFDFLMVDGLKTAFGYASGVTYYVTSTSTPMDNTNIRNALLGTLDAGLPAVLGISTLRDGHSIVADGYGYYAGVLFAHLNLGWNGSQDAWYNLEVFDVSTSYHFTLFDDVSYNIHPTQTGEYITGRTLDSTGAALPGATVTASNTLSGATYTATSNGKGIYAVNVPSPAATYEISAQGGGSRQTACATSVPVRLSTMCDYYWSGSDMYLGGATQYVGNRWGNDLTLLTPAELTAQLIQWRSLGEAVNNTALKWKTSGNTQWFVQTAVTHDGVAALQSAAIGNLQHSTVQTTVTGPGMLSFWWRASSEDGYDKLKFYIDGAEQPDTISGEPPWEQKTFSIAAGTHTLKWSYEKDPFVISGSDCGWLDQVAWAPAGFVAATNALHTTVAYVPESWLDEMYPLHVGDAVALASGKGPNGYHVWESFIAGLTPTNPASRFCARITLVNGEPEITWHPNLVGERDYTVFGNPGLTPDGWSAPYGPDARFFKVTVEMP